MRQFLHTLKRSRIATSAVALILALSVLISSFGGLSIFAGVANGAWSGNEANKYASGAGNVDDPYVIETPEQLALLVSEGAEKTAGKYYVLANNIYLNDTSKADWKTSAKEWYFETKDGENFDASKAFAGHFDGKGHVVYGLYIDEKLSDTSTAKNRSVAAGLFPIIGAGATITSVAVANSHIAITTNAADSTAAYAGYVGSIGGIILKAEDQDGKRVTIDRCYLEDNTYLAGAFLGLIGSQIDSTGVTVSNCYNIITTANWKAHTFGDQYNRPAIIAGNTNNVTYKGCFTGSVVNTLGSNGGCGSNSSNNYGCEWFHPDFNAYCTSISNSDMKGIAAATAMSGLDFDTVYIATAGYPKLRVFVNALGNPNRYDVWDGTVSAYLSGHGNAASPYLITNAADLAFLAKNGGTEGAYYKLVNDIYLNDLDKVNWTTGLAEAGYTPREWVASGAFQGTLDGNGKVVYGLYYNRAGTGNWRTGYALFASATGTAVIKNLGIDSSYLSVTGSTGNAAAFVFNNLASSLTMNNVYVGSGVKVSGGQYGAAFIGVSDHTFTLENFYNLGVIEGTKAGVVADSYSWENVGAVTSTMKNGFTVGSITTKNQNAAKYQSNLYATVESAGNTATILSANDMMGYVAKDNLSGLDFDNVFVTVDNNYPDLRVFGRYTANAVPKDESLWDGTLKAPTKGGNGSDEANAIEIETPSELAYVINNGGESKYYKLTADIYLNDVNKITWNDGTVADGYTANEWIYGTNENGNVYNNNTKFSGTLDGNGHTVYGIYYTPGNTYTAVGLVPATNQATIKNLQIKDSFICGGRYTAALVADATKTTVSQVVIDESVTIWGYNAGNHYYNTNANQWTYSGNTSSGFAFSPAVVGGLIGYGHTSVTIENVAVYAKTKLADFEYTTTNALVAGGAPIKVGALGHYGGILGTTYSCSVNVTNTVSLIKAQCGHIHSSDVLTYTNTYYVNEHKCGGNTPVSTKVTVGDITGVTAQNVLTGLDWTLWKATETYPTLTQFWVAPTRPVTGLVWDGTELAPNEGTGTEADPYLIYSAEQLAYVIGTGGAENTYYKLMADILLNDVSKINTADGTTTGGYIPKEWYKSTLPSGQSYDGKEFKGTIDGNGHSVLGLYYAPGNAYTAVGLIPVGRNATVKNLQIKDSFISGGRWTSALIGYSYGTATVSNVVVDETVTLFGYNAGNHHYNTSYYDAATGKAKNPFNKTDPAVGPITFESTALGVITAYSNNACNVSDVAVYANIKYNEFDYTITNENTNGGAPAKVSGTNDYGYVLGTAWYWNGTANGAALNVTDAVLGGEPYKKGAGVATFTDTYAVGGGKNSAVKNVTEDDIKGANAATKLTGLDFTATWQTTNYIKTTLQMFYDATLDVAPPAAPGQVWNGTTVAPTRGGDGSSEAEAILIYTAEELAYVVANYGEGKYYKLAADILLNDTAKVDWVTGTPADGYTANEWYGSTTNQGQTYGSSTSKTFTGTIDGDGHTVYGLYYKPDSAYTAVGIVPVGSSVTFKNLRVAKSFVRGGRWASVLQGYSYGSTNISSIVVEDTVTIKGFKKEADMAVMDSAALGVLTAYSNDAINVSNVAVYANVSGTHDVGYVVGTAWKAGNTAIVNVTDAVLAGHPYKKGAGVATFTDTYAVGGGPAGVTAIIGSDFKGADAATKLAGLDFTNVWQAATYGKATLKMFYNAEEDLPQVPTGEPTTPIVWDGVTLTEPNGTGSAGDPIRIASAANLAWLLKNGTSADKYYIFTQDILINDVDKINWATGEVADGYNLNSWFKSTDVVKVEGHFDGNGKVVYGLYYKDTTPVPNSAYNVGFGLFPIAGAVEIKGLGIDKAYLEAYTNYSLGVLIGHGQVMLSGTVEECYSGANVTVKGYDAGALVGGGDIAGILTIKNSYSLATVIKEHRGGLVGDAWASKYAFENVYTVGSALTGSGLGVSSQTNCYLFDAGTTIIKGDGAKEAMSALDWNDMFIAIPGEYPMLKRFYKMDPATYWNGTDAIAPSVGDGTVNNPWQIGTPAELAYVVKNGANSGVYYQLVADIYLNDISQITWKNGIVKGGYTVNSWYKSDEVAAFAGNFDGNGFHVYGLYYKAADTNKTSGGMGLFPKAGNGITVSKLGVDKAYLEFYSDYALGAVIGYINAEHTGSITESYVGSDVVVKGYDAAAFVGGGPRNADFVIENCYSLATVDYTHRGGLIGDTWRNPGETARFIVRSTYVAGTDVNKGTSTPGVKVFGNTAASCSASNVYAVQGTGNGITIVELSAMQGMSALTDTMPNLNKEAFRATEGYPQLAAFLPVIPVPEAGVWDGTTAQGFALGTGTENDPYLIHNASELALVVSTGGGQNKFYKIVNDIYINDPAIFDHTTGGLKEGKTGDIRQWVTGSDFTGTLDGDGHVIYGLYFDVAGNKASANAGYGLFRKTWGNATIKNLGVDNAFVNGPNGASAFVGYNACSKLTIAYSFVGANVTLNGQDAGAFVSVNDHPAELNHVYSWGTLIAAKNKGLIGDMWDYKENKGVSGSSIKFSYNAAGPISSKTTVGTTESIFASVSGGGGTVVSAADMSGLTVFNNKKPMQVLNVDKAWQATNGYPILDIFADDPYGPDGEEYVPSNGMDENGVWDGTIAKAFSDSSVGTEDDPILIANPAELALAIKSGGDGKYYRLTADIYLNETRVSNLWHSKANNNVWLSKSKAADPGFNGHLDGDGYCVYGIWYPANQTGAVGLVPVLAGGSIKNLGVRYSLIQSKQNLGAGAIAGVSRGVDTIEQCFADDSVSVKSQTSGGIVGLAQQNSSTVTKGLVIRNCYSKVSLTSSDANKSNQLIGNPWITAYEIYNSYCIGRPYCTWGGANNSMMYWDYEQKWDAETNKATVLKSQFKDGKNAEQFFQNVYGTAATGTYNVWEQVSKDYMYGEEAKDAMPGLEYGTVWVTVAEGTPILKIFADRGLSGKDIDLSADSEMFGLGSGTMNDPYLIENVEQLRYLVNSDATAGKYYALANDIYINDTSKANWMNNSPAKWYVDLIGSPFKGTFDGNGYEIHGIYIDETPTDPKTLAADANYVNGKAAGLFPYVHTSASIRNLHIRNSMISGAGSVGAIAGHMTGSSDTSALFIGCSVDESVTINGFTVGGLIGAGSNTPVSIYYSYCTANLKNTGPADRVNGLIGDIWGAQLEIVDCYVVGYKILRGQVGMKSNVYGNVHSSITTVVPLEQMYGDLAKSSMSGFDWKNIWYTVPGKTPQLKYVTSEMLPVFNDEGEVGRVWSGLTATKFAGGKGTEANPYLIETPEQLAYLIKGKSKANAYYKLMADIKLNDTSKVGWEATAKEWYAGYTFNGHFDGNYHIVSGLFFNKTDASACGLFPTLSENSTVQRIGIVSSSITNNKLNSSHPIAAALVGTLTNFDGLNGVNAFKEGYKEKPPVISECFIGSDVIITGDTTGGIIGGGGAVAHVYNCYALPTLSYTYRGGAIFGDLWEAGDPDMIVENCYGATTDADPIGDGPQATGQYTTFKNVYVDGRNTTAAHGATQRLFLMFMQGTNAKTHMLGFDWNNIWATVGGEIGGGTPVLKGFKFAENHTSKREPSKVSVNFITGDGATTVEPIYGYPGFTEIDHKSIPEPERFGYKFLGWYFFESGDLKFDLDKFPMFDLYIFAHWEKLGFEQGFEGDMYPEYDVNAGAQYFRPGVAGYNPRYIHGGLRSMQMKGDTTEAPMFLLYYQYKLEIGQKYKVSFFMTSREDGASGEVNFLHANYADVNDEIVGSETVLEFKNLKGGKWVQYECEITANAPYIIVSTTPGVELFFDDFSVIPTGEEGKLGELEGFNPGAINAEPGAGLPVIWIIVIVVGGVILLGGIAAVTIILVKKGKKGAAAPADAPAEETPTDSAEE